MKRRGFSLLQFRSESLLPDLRVTAEIGRVGDALSLSYTVRGPLDEISIAKPAASPERSNGLWEETCFELFLGAAGSDKYWEFNISPSGHWNVYRFEAYREGMQEEQAFASLPFDLLSRPDTLKLSLELRIDRTVPDGQDLEAGISAVIRTTSGKTTYWALAHPGTQPDFHRRDGFIIKL